MIRPSQRWVPAVAFESVTAPRSASRQLPSHPGSSVRVVFCANRRKSPSPHSSATETVPEFVVGAWKRANTRYVPTWLMCAPPPVACVDRIALNVVDSDVLRSTLDPDAPAGPAVVVEPAIAVRP